MSNFQSTIKINRPGKEVYDFLADMNNHEQLMAGDDISEWSSTHDEARFSIRNMIKLALKIEERVPDTIIRIVPAEEPPFNLELTWTLSAEGDHTDAELTIEADLNMMMKMLASGPLKKLANDETTNLFNLLG